MTTISLVCLVACYLAWYAAIRRRSWRVVNVATAAVFVSTAFFLVSLYQ